jgi:hypothetical protein
VIVLFVVLGLVLAGAAAASKLFAGGFSPLHGESQIHRCDFCKEAILLIDDDARCFVQHAGRRPLLGYTVVNACGACARDRMVDGVFSSKRADPSA